MKYLLNNKLYDTEKAEKIITYITKIEIENSFLGLNYKTYPRYRITLYKTKKGTFFKHIGECVEDEIKHSNFNYIELISENEVKQILNKLNAIDVYKKIFDDLEEG